MFTQARDVQKIEKIEEAVTAWFFCLIEEAGCPNTAALVFLTQNLSCRCALSTPNISVFIPANASLAVSPRCSVCSANPAEGAKGSAAFSGPGGKGNAPAEWTMSKRRKKNRKETPHQTIWSHCHEWQHSHSKQMATFSLGHTRN